MKLDVRVNDVTGLVANLYARDERVQVDVRDAVQRFGVDVRVLARDLAPVDTGFMREQIRDEYSPEGLTVQVGYREEDFTAKGLPFYAPYQEYGTVYMAAQPHIGPAYRAMLPHFKEDVSAILRRAFT